jgi:hypothetical protein
VQGIGVYFQQYIKKRLEKQIVSILNQWHKKSHAVNTTWLFYVKSIA